MKRLPIVLATVGLAVSVTSEAGVLPKPAFNDFSSVSVPELPGGFVLGGTAYYLQPSDSNGDLDYATINSGVSPAFTSQTKYIQPGYNWGWSANIGYIFPNTGNDINLSYFNLNTSDTSSVAIPATAGSSSLIPIGFLPPILNNTFLAPAAAAAKAEYDIKQVDLTAGQFIDVGCRLRLHPMAGVRWTSLDRELSTAENGFFMTSSGFPQQVFTTSKDDSDFKGIGPLIGLDANYYLGLGLGVVGHFDSALLVGDNGMNDEMDAAILSTDRSGAVTSKTYHFEADSAHRIVPVMDAKLGANYTFLFNNSMQSDLTLEAGYQVSKYFNVVNRIHATVLNINSPFAITQLTTSNLGLNGPYVSLTLHV